ncbi:EamA family transporter [Ferviditalea candida]|uniref:DMT family transporter n=1 Tax=Ferviditalea candida TaxID=3108399 RepID=A0ABU5ZK34_9BACL|nr:DMT family transporter [Paenibacillaceae bacterium T2]
MSGIIIAILATVSYSLSYVFLRKAQTTSNLPDHGLFPVLGIGGFMLGLSLLIQIFRSPNQFEAVPNLNHLIMYCIIVGITGTLIGRRAFYAAIHDLGATRSVIIKTLQPVITMMIAVTILGETFNRTDMIGIVLLLTGVALLYLEPIILPPLRLKFIHHGLMLGFFAASLYGISDVIRKIVMHYPISPLFAAGIEMNAAFFVYLLVLAIRGRLRDYVNQYIHVFNRNLLMAGVLSASGRILFFTALITTPVFVASPILAIQPILVALFSVIFRVSEKIGLFVYISVIMVTISIIVIGSN